MIVKNEERILRRCLDTVVDLVDEIVIVDTGSDTQTPSGGHRTCICNYMDGGLFGCP